MTNEQLFFRIIGFIVIIGFILWLVERLRNRNVVVVEEDKDTTVERIVEQPIIQQQPVFRTQPVFQQTSQMPSRGASARVQGGQVSK